jgi:hypothetical protein
VLPLEISVLGFKKREFRVLLLRQYHSTSSGENLCFVRAATSVIPLPLPVTPTAYHKLSARRK